jgi:CheY-like chemotaxis protein
MQPLHTHGPLRVLVADDNRDGADSLALLLQLWGHHPVVAYDGAAALATALDSPPDAALLDIGMPGVDGCELARRLRQAPGLGKTLLVAVTGHARQEDRRRCLEAGFDHFIPKPYDPRELERLLARAAAAIAESRELVSRAKEIGAETERLIEKAKTLRAEARRLGEESAGRQAHEGTGSQGRPGVTRAGDDILSALTQEEFRLACDACRAVRVAGSPAVYVRALLVHLLTPLHPGLAAKVARLPPGQMEVLRDLIGELQEAGGGLLA